MQRNTDRPRKPAEKPSDEAKTCQLDLAREQGDSFQHAVTAMTQRVAHGAEQRAGDYLVGYAVEKAEGLYFPRDGELQWQEPENENAHLEIVVRDAGDGRFLPDLTVYATLTCADGREVGTHRQPFLWHPWIYHYGRNWQVPGDGEYDLHVRVEAPGFPRHDKTNSRRYTEPAEVDFHHVKIETGRNES